MRGGARGLLGAVLVGGFLRLLVLSWSPALLLLAAGVLLLLVEVCVECVLGGRGGGGY